METADQAALRGLLESVWIKVQMLQAPIDAISGELIEEDAAGAYALGVGLQALYQSLQGDCLRLDTMFNLRDTALRRANALFSRA